MIMWRKFEGFNPANGVKLKREPNAHIRFLNKEEIQLLEENLRGTNLYPYFMGALQTGLRLRELCGVKWENVTFPLRDIFIPKSKSGKSRHIPVSDMLYEMLLERFGAGKPDEDLVFGTLHPCHVSHRFMAKCRELGIKDFRFHDLRHTFASQLVMAGVNVFKVSKWLGHSGVMMTEKYYAHLSPDSQREEINFLNRLSVCCPKSAQTNFRQTTEMAPQHGIQQSIENSILIR
jgi:integrase